MTQREKIEFYDKYSKMIPSIEKPNYDDVLSEIIRYHRRRNANKKAEDLEIEKMGFVTEILPSFEIAKNKASADTLFSLCNYLNRSGNFPSYYLSALLDLSFNPKDIFNCDEKSNDAKIYFSFYSRIIDYIFIIESFYMDEEIPNITPIIYTHEALLISGFNTYYDIENSFLSEIIIYCISKGYDIDKLKNMITYSFDHIDDIDAYLLLNNTDDNHEYELTLSILKKIDENLDNIREIR